MHFICTGRGQAQQGAPSRFVLTCFARHQRRKLRKAMLRGRLEAVKQGKHQGKPPFGYRKVDGKLVPDPETSLAVQKIFDWYAEGWGGDRIAKALKEKGLVMAY